MVKSASATTLAAMGMANALGSTNEEIFGRLLQGDCKRFSHRDDLVPGKRLLIGQVREELPELPNTLARYDCRNNRLALLVLRQIEREVHQAISSFGTDRVGIVVGSSTSGIAEGEAAIAAHLHKGTLSPAFDLVQVEFGGLAECVAALTGANGPCYTLSTACSSGAKAVTSAHSLIELDLCDAVITGGVDSICRLTSNGFSSLQVVSEELTNPMSINRRGLTLGEGGALFLLSREPGDVRMLGIGESSDAHHMSAPDPEGGGAETAMHAALDNAGLKPQEIDYLNLHGTGTLHNDAMESVAIARVFGDKIPPCSSTKPLTGHTLGASGAIELGFCWMIAQRVAELRKVQEPPLLTLPPHRFDGERDPALPRLPLIELQSHTVKDASAPTALMSNSFGFGGSNCTLILGEPRGILGEARE